MKNFVKCACCLSHAEYRLLDMDLCLYHFIKLNNDIYCKDGIDKYPELMRLLE